MENRVIERAYESVRGYLPEDANAVLSEQVPQIEQFIDEDPQPHRRRHAAGRRMGLRD